MTDVLDASTDVIAWHRRRLSSRHGSYVVDHLVVTAAGAFLMEERSWPGSFSLNDGSLIRHRMGPGGQWAKGAETDRIDQIRRTAEAVESLISRPVEPVLVLAEGKAAFSGPVQVRGVTVLLLEDVSGWIQSLPSTIDRAEMVLVSARLERALPSANTPQRIPVWQQHRVGTRSPGRRHPKDPAPVRTGPGPRDYSLPLRITPASDPCAAPTRVPAASAGGPSRGFMWSLVALGVLAVGIFMPGLAVGAADWVKANVMDWSRSGAASPESLTPPVPEPVPPSQPAPPRATPRPTILLNDCVRLSPEQVSATLRQPVFRLSGSSNSTCDFGPDPEALDQVLVSVSVGSDAVARNPSRASGPMWTLTYPAGSAAPGPGDGILGSPLRISLSPRAAVGNADDGRGLAETLAAELVMGR
ncbi:MAG TPA: nuclease-related domain-containing protein [Actinomycetales bacterium]|nr:nuclease-related domain-containing protein [Actinomycetales bacterium]